MKGVVHHIEADLVEMYQWSRVQPPAWAQALVDEWDELTRLHAEFHDRYGE